MKAISCVASIVLACLLSSCGSVQTYSLSGQVDANSSGLVEVFFGNQSLGELAPGETFQAQLPEFSEYKVKIVADNQFCLATPNQGVIQSNIEVQVVCTNFPAELVDSLHLIQDGLLGRAEMAQVSQYLQRQYQQPAVQEVVQTVNEFGHTLQFIAERPTELAHVAGHFQSTIHAARSSWQTGISALLGTGITLARAGTYALMRLMSQLVIQVGAVLSELGAALLVPLAELAGLVTFYYGLIFIVTRVVSLEYQWAVNELFVPLAEALDTALYESFGIELDRFEENESVRRAYCAWNMMEGPLYNSADFDQQVSDLLTSWNPATAIEGGLDLGGDLIEFMGEVSGFLYEQGLAEVDEFSEDPLGYASQLLFSDEEYDWGALGQILLGQAPYSPVNLITKNMLNAARVLLTDFDDGLGDSFGAFLDEASSFAIGGAAPEMEAAIQDSKTACFKLSYQATLFDESEQHGREYLTWKTFAAGSRQFRHLFQYQPVFYYFRPIRRNLILVQTNLGSYRAYTNDRGYASIDLDYDEEVEYVYFDANMNSDYLSRIEHINTNCSENSTWSLNVGYGGNDAQGYVYDRLSGTYLQDYDFYAGGIVSEQFGNNYQIYVPAVSDEYPAAIENDRTEIDHREFLRHAQIEDLERLSYPFQVLDAAQRVIEHFCSIDPDLQLPQLNYVLDDNTYSPQMHGQEYMRLKRTRASDGSPAYRQTLGKHFWGTNMSTTLYAILHGIELFYHGRSDRFSESNLDMLSAGGDWESHAGFSLYQQMTPTDLFSEAWVLASVAAIYPVEDRYLYPYSGVFFDNEALQPYAGYYSLSSAVMVLMDLFQEFGYSDLLSVRHSDAFNETLAFQTLYAFFAHFYYHRRYELGSTVEPFWSILEGEFGLKRPAYKSFECPKVPLIELICKDYNRRQPKIDVFDFRNVVGRSVNPQNPRKYSMYNVWELYLGTDEVNNNVIEGYHIGGEQEFLEYNYLEPAYEDDPVRGLFNYRIFPARKDLIFKEDYYDDGQIGVRGAWPQAYARLKMSVLRKGNIEPDLNNFNGLEVGALTSIEGEAPLLLPFGGSFANHDDILLFVVEEQGDYADCFWMKYFFQNRPTSIYYGYQGRDQYEDFACSHVAHNPSQEAFPYRE